jgi:hypothetical protein
MFSFLQHSKSSSVTLISHVQLIFVSFRFLVFHLTFYSEGIAIVIANSKPTNRSSCTVATDRLFPLFIHDLNNST